MVQFIGGSLRAQAVAPTHSQARAVRRPRSFSGW
uniref:Uncharacterized protein n=1 Tax=Picea sitchensis TaxID=3332 RepID=A9NM52_PICSI|nr:unknown [Picea sitchensis]